MVGKRAVNPLKGMSLGARLRLFATNGPIHPAFFGRTLGLCAVSLLRAPFNGYEALKYREAIRATEIIQDPIFIIGHWRSGTTHLHNLMARDERLGFVSLFETSLPQSFLTQAGLKERLSQQLPETRPMDNMQLSFDLPQEEEFALANLCPYSVYHGLTFPRRVREHFRRYVLFDGVRPAVLRKWQLVYVRFLKKVTYARQGKQLVLKSPVNTARIRLVLDLFPEAKFVHIYRNPYEVFVSTLHLLKALSEPMRLQNWPEEDLSALVFEFYRAMMMRYFAERDLILGGHLVEVRFEDLVSCPLAELKRIYEVLELGSFGEVEERFQCYLDGQKAYRQNAYRFTEDLIADIQKNWDFTISKWGYEAPEVS